jgi:hypothetical protein
LCDSPRVRCGQTDHRRENDTSLSTPKVCCCTRSSIPEVRTVTQALHRRTHDRSVERLRPAKDWENLNRNALAFLKLASIRLMSYHACYAIIDKVFGRTFAAAERRLLTGRCEYDSLSRHLWDAQMRGTDRPSWELYVISRSGCRRSIRCAYVVRRVVLAALDQDLPKHTRRAVGPRSLLNSCRGRCCLQAFYTMVGAAADRAARLQPSSRRR